MLLQNHFVQGLAGGTLERLLIKLASGFENLALGLHKDAETLQWIREQNRKNHRTPNHAMYNYEGLITSFSP